MTLKTTNICIIGLYCPIGRRVVKKWIVPMLLIVVGMGIVFMGVVFDDEQGHSREKPLDNPLPPMKTSPYSTANNAFAADLYTALLHENEGKNIFFSPFSVTAALTMTLEGVRGKTEEEMAKTLHYPINPNGYEQFHTSLSQLMKPTDSSHYLTG